MDVMEQFRAARKQHRKKEKRRRHKERQRQAQPPQPKRVKKVDSQAPLIQGMHEMKIDVTQLECFKSDLYQKL